MKKISSVDVIGNFSTDLNTVTVLLPASRFF